MKLIFHTPSKRCPHRHRNGQEVEVLTLCRSKLYVRRAKRLLDVYVVCPVGKPTEGWYAYADELHLEPR